MRPQHLLLLPDFHQAVSGPSQLTLTPAAAPGSPEAPSGPGPTNPTVTEGKLKRGHALLGPAEACRLIRCLHFNEKYDVVSLDVLSEANTI